MISWSHWIKQKQKKRKTTTTLMSRHRRTCNVLTHLHRCAFLLQNSLFACEMRTCCATLYSTRFYETVESSFLHFFFRFNRNVFSLFDCSIYSRLLTVISCVNAQNRLGILDNCNTLWWTIICFIFGWQMNKWMTHKCKCQSWFS